MERREDSRRRRRHRRLVALIVIVIVGSGRGRAGLAALARLGNGELAARGRRVARPGEPVRRRPGAVRFADGERLAVGRRRRDGRSRARARPADAAGGRPPIVQDLVPYGAAAQGRDGGLQQAPLRAGHLGAAPPGHRAALHGDLDLRRRAQHLRCERARARRAAGRRRPLRDRRERHHLSAGAARRARPAHRGSRLVRRRHRVRAAGGSGPAQAIAQIFARPRQVDAGLRLVAWLQATYDISSENVIGHAMANDAAAVQGPDRAAQRPRRLGHGGGTRFRQALASAE